MSKKYIVHLTMEVRQAFESAMNNGVEVALPTNTLGADK